MTPWENVWQFKTARFALSLCFAPDDDLDLSWDETGETREKLSTGEWSAFRSRVRLFLDGDLIAEDHLGGSIYANPRDFFTSHLGLAKQSRDDGRTYGDYFSDMVREVIREARAKIAAHKAIKLR